MQIYSLGFLASLIFSQTQPQDAPAEIWIRQREQQDAFVNHYTYRTASQADGLQQNLIDQFLLDRAQSLNLDSQLSDLDKQTRLFQEVRDFESDLRQNYDCITNWENCRNRFNNPSAEDEPFGYAIDWIQKEFLKGGHKAFFDLTGVTELAQKNTQMSLIAQGSLENQINRREIGERISTEDSWVREVYNRNVSARGMGDLVTNLDPEERMERDPGFAAVMNMAAFNQDHIVERLKEAVLSGDEQLKDELSDALGKRITNEVEKITQEVRKARETGQNSIQSVQGRLDKIIHSVGDQGAQNQLRYLALTGQLREFQNLLENSLARDLRNIREKLDTSELDSQKREIYLPYAQKIQDPNVRARLLSHLQNSRFDEFRFEFEQARLAQIEAARLEQLRTQKEYQDAMSNLKTAQVWSNVLIQVIQPKDPELASQIKVGVEALISVAQTSIALEYGQIGITAATGNYVMAGLMIYSTFFAKKKADNGQQKLWKSLFSSLQSISNQIRSMHIEMRSRFDAVDLRLNLIMERLVNEFEQTNQNIDRVYQRVDQALVELRELRSYQTEIFEQIRQSFHGIIAAEVFNCFYKIEKAKRGHPISENEFLDCQQAFYIYGTQSAADPSISRYVLDRNATSEQVLSIFSTSYPPAASGDSRESLALANLAFLFEAATGERPFDINPLEWARAASYMLMLSETGNIPREDSYIEDLQSLYDIGSLLQTRIHGLTSSYESFFKRLVERYQVRTTSVKQALQDYVLAFGAANTNSQLTGLNLLRNLDDQVISYSANLTERKVSECEFGLEKYDNYKDYYKNNGLPYNRVPAMRQVSFSLTNEEFQNFIPSGFLVASSLGLGQVGICWYVAGADFKFSEKVKFKNDIQGANIAKVPVVQTRKVPGHLQIGIRAYFYPSEKWAEFVKRIYRTAGSNEETELRDLALMASNTYRQIVPEEAQPLSKAIISPMEIFSGTWLSPEIKDLFLLKTTALKVQPDTDFDKEVEVLDSGDDQNVAVLQDLLSSNRDTLAKPQQYLSMNNFHDNNQRRKDGGRIVFASSNSHLAPNLLPFAKIFRLYEKDLHSRLATQLRAGLMGQANDTSHVSNAAVNQKEDILRENLQELDAAIVYLQNFSLVALPETILLSSQFSGLLFGSHRLIDSQHIVEVLSDRNSETFIEFVRSLRTRTSTRVQNDAFEVRSQALESYLKELFLRDESNQAVPIKERTFLIDSILSEISKVKEQIQK